MFERNSEGKTSQIEYYFNQVQGPMATLSTLQRFGFFLTPAVKAICLQELTGCFRPRLSPNAKIGHLPKAEAAFRS